MRKDDCIFCKIASGDIPSKTIYEDEYFRGILDLSPATKGHTLILPKEHFADLFEMTPEYLERVLPVAQIIARKLQERLCCKGVNLIQNNGSIAGQTVFHFHLHIIPRYEDDGQVINWLPQEVSSEYLDNLYLQLN